MVGLQRQQNKGKHLGPVTGPVLILIKFVFYGKYCVHIDKCVFIVVKIKCVNTGRISDICDKINFITKLHTFYKTPNRHFIKTYTTSNQNTH